MCIKFVVNIKERVFMHGEIPRKEVSKAMCLMHLYSTVGQFRLFAVLHEMICPARLCSVRQLYNIRGFLKEW